MIRETSEFVCTVVLAAAIGTAVGAAVAPPSSLTDTADQASVRVFDATGHGSGTVIANGLVLTARHVVVDAKGDIKVRLSNNEERVAHVAMVGVDERHDYALLQVDTTGITPAHVSCAKPHQGDKVMAYGDPLQITRIATWGRIADRYEVQNKGAPIGSRIMDMTVAPGNSGGGVWNENGELVGIVDALLIMPGNPDFVVAPTGHSVMIEMSAVCPLIGR